MVSTEGVQKMTIDGKKLFAEVVENNRRWTSCDGHRFAAIEPYRIGQRHTCIKCGGTKSMIDIMYYLEGYEAAGGDPNDVMPGYRTPAEG
jgi:hypothetical protein